MSLKTNRLTAVAVVAGIVGIDWGKPPRETQTRNLNKYLTIYYKILQEVISGCIVREQQTRSLEKFNHRKNYNSFDQKYAQNLASEKFLKNIDGSIIL